MTQQILFIRGGDTFESYNDYISYLKNKKVNLEKLKVRKDWKHKLQINLGEGFEVFLPEMPNRANARYEEWKIWFEKIIPLLDENLILAGSSLGGIFLAKYLSENKINKKIKAVILVAAPFDGSTNEESLVYFKLPDSLSKFAEQCENVYLIQSRDDELVLFEEVEKYKKELPNAKLVTFEDRGHFNQEDFPEIVDLIKKI
ncbi:MAG: alpha/beta hydrolase [Candidatus Shapirobacteria bacterium]